MARHDNAGLTNKQNIFKKVLKIFPGKYLRSFPMGAILRWVLIKQYTPSFGVRFLKTSLEDDIGTHQACQSSFVSKSALKLAHTNNYSLFSLFIFLSDS